MSDGLFDGVLARGGAAVGDRAWLQAMLDAEAALPRARASVGQIGADVAEAIAAECSADRFDIGALGRDAVRGGNPAAPLAKALTARVAGPDDPHDDGRGDALHDLRRAAAGEVHRGFTSQDVVDTALMLVFARARPALLADVRGAADACAGLAADHRDTPIAGRTLLQQAVPTTFGLKAAGWSAGLDGALARLEAFRPAAQLGGAAGTLASLGDHALQVRAAFAAQLGLDDPALPWHTERGRIAELAAALGAACAAIAKVAGDVVLMAQTEVAEVREGTGGTSSTMPHKHNPVAAVSALGCARPAPGHVAAVLTAAGGHEHERAAGSWHAEWAPLRALLAGTISAAAWLRECVSGLEIDGGRMRANIHELTLAERAATELADDVGRERANELVAEAAKAGRLPEGARVDPADAVGSAAALVDRFLARRQPS
jgi:3-carboxy-cis,cis-muconate cycloisomerase